MEDRNIPFKPALIGVMGYVIDNDHAELHEQDFWKEKDDFDTEVARMFETVFDLLGLQHPAAEDMEPYYDLLESHFYISWPEQA